MAMRTQFRDRSEAGQLLAEKLVAYANRTDVIVLALPRGGVPVAAEVTRRLNAPAKRRVLARFQTLTYCGTWLSRRRNNQTVLLNPKGKP